MNNEFIRERRIKLGLSMQSVAEKMGYKNASTYSKYESGEYKLDANMLPVLAEILECSINDFFKKDSQ